MLSIFDICYLFAGPKLAMRLTCLLRQQSLSHPRLRNFVPPSKDVSINEVEQLQDFILRTKRLLVITGAGLSTESGIPDYRSEGVGLYARTDRYYILMC